METNFTPRDAGQDTGINGCRKDLDPGSWVIFPDPVHRLYFPGCLDIINLSLPCEIALVQHASLVAKTDLAALGDLRVRIVFDLEKTIVNLCTLRPARNLLHRRQGLTAMHASHAAWEKYFALGDHLARNASLREEKSVRLIWNLTRRVVQGKGAHGPGCRAA